ncbi:MAG: hypothetical protein JNK35_13665 [Phycisphaerae bacterium]|nr:hypothetical protein [Phycisphaerae bacterium]
MTITRAVAILALAIAASAPGACARPPAPAEVPPARAQHERVAQTPRVEKPSTPPVAAQPPNAGEPRTAPKPASEPPAPSRPNLAFPPGPISQPTLADVYVFVACASANNPSERWSEPAWVRKGLPRMVEEQLLPLYRRGFRRFYIDSPHGKDTDPAGKPQFTFFGALRGDDRSSWRKNFVESWRRLTALDGVHVIAYLGNPHFDTEFTRTLAGPDGRARAADMLTHAVQPILDAGFQGIGIDASADTSETSVLGDFMKSLQARGVAVYVEATPSRTQPWLLRFGTVRTTWFAREASAFASKLFSPNDCAGERIVLYSGTAPWPDADDQPFHDWARRWVHECLSRGERPAFGVQGFKDAAKDLGLPPSRSP